jgi:hypothetical protein
MSGWIDERGLRDGRLDVAVGPPERFEGPRDVLFTALLAACFADFFAPLAIRFSSWVCDHGIASVLQPAVGRMISVNGCCAKQSARAKPDEREQQRPVR